MRCDPLLQEAQGPLAAVPVLAGPSLPSSLSPPPLAPPAAGAATAPSATAGIKMGGTSSAGSAGALSATTSWRGAADVYVGGTVSGLAQVVVGYPFDSVKVLMQAAPIAAGAGAGSGAKPPGALAVLRETVRTSGARALFRGVTSPMAGVGFCNAIVFTAHTGALAHVPRGWNPHARAAAAGATAGLCVSFAACPIEHVKIRMQTCAATAHRGALATARALVRDHGVRHGLFRGWAITAVRDVPSFAAYFATYQALRDELRWAPLAAGAAAGIACWLPCYAQDVVKTRIQSAPMDQRVHVLAAAREVARAGRVWRGLAPTLLRAAPTNAATFAVYELYRKLHVF